MTRFSVRVAPGVATEKFPGFLGARGGMALDRGIFAEARLHDGRASLLGAGGKDVGGESPEIIDEIGRLPARDLIIAGVIARSRSGAAFIAYDLLHLDGFGLRGVAPDRRTALLRAFLDEAGADRIRMTRSTPECG